MKKSIERKIADIRKSKDSIAAAQALEVARNFEKIGWLERTGRDKTGINFKATEEFRNIIEITLANKQK